MNLEMGGNQRRKNNKLQNYFNALHKHTIHMYKALIKGQKEWMQMASITIFLQAILTFVRMHKIAQVHFAQVYADRDYQAHLVHS